MNSRCVHVPCHLPIAGPAQKVTQLLVNGAVEGVLDQPIGGVLAW